MTNPCQDLLDPTCVAARHGYASAYKYGCRCPDAREAWRLYNKRRREGRLTPQVVDATGTVRRLRALMATGWTVQALADQLGTTRTAMHLLSRRKRCYRTTARDIADLYDRLSMTPGTSRETQRRATVAGWAPPLAWDNIDDPDARPQGVGPARRAHTFAGQSAPWYDDLEQLTARGWSVRDTARQLAAWHPDDQVSPHAWERRVFRRRQRQRQEEAA